MRCALTAPAGRRGRRSAGQRVGRDREEKNCRDHHGHRKVRERYQPMLHDFLSSCLVFVASTRLVSSRASHADTCYHPLAHQLDSSQYLTADSSSDAAGRFPDVFQPRDHARHDRIATSRAKEPQRSEATRERRQCQVQSWSSGPARAVSLENSWELARRRHPGSC